MNQSKHIVGLREVGIGDVDWVGGKNASLGEMIQHLSPLGINIPDGFVITVNAYRHFIKTNELDKFITERLAEINFDNIESLRRIGLQIRSSIRNARFPHDLSLEIIERYHALSSQYGQVDTDVAGAFFGHRRGFAGCEFCGSAGNISERTRTGRSD